MKQAIRFDEELHDIKTRVIETILEHLSAANAEDVSLTHPLMLPDGEGDDEQFSPTIDRIRKNGVVAHIYYDLDEEWNFEDCSTDQLIALLTKLETNEFEIYEDSAEQEG